MRFHPLRLRRWLALLCLALLAAAAAAQKPPAAAVATAHPLATTAARDILQAGGNAFDAAVAASAALAVVEPYSSGIGGGGFWLLHRAEDGLQIMIDGREVAPRAATPDMYLAADDGIRQRASRDGALAAAIPGAPAAWAHIAERYGRLSLAQSLAPAIRLAREGFAVDEFYQRMVRLRLEALRRDPQAAAIFLADNEVPPVGWKLRQPDLARTLERLAAEGAAGFYRGELAKRLVAAVRAANGIWSEQDLADYTVQERPPVTGHYRGIRIVSAPPPSAGGIGLIQMLNMLSGYDLERLPPAQRVHVIVEAMRRAYRDRAAYLGDPDFVDMPLAMLLDPFYARGLAQSIRPDRATPSRLLAPALPDQPGGSHTTHLSILDAEGNRVAATLTINHLFGAAVVAGDTGVLLNNEMDDFAAALDEPNFYGLVGTAPNLIAPGKRPLSSMTPTFLETENRIGVLGTPGGSRIVTMVLLATLAFEQGLPPTDWVGRGRFHHQYLPDEIQLEPDALDPQVRKELTAMGHELRVLERRYGDMQAILWDRAAGQVLAASDPRGIGAAEVFAVTSVPVVASEWD
ncbi:MAG: gamma-glutamyltransferase [Xanthomonadaceae bacterium]|nr:gamma-glutamyltransferase [Xanthomonadaceae bacterium]